MRIYLDNCCFNRPFDDQGQFRVYLESQAKLYIQEEIKNGKYELAWSYILDYENSLNPYWERRNSIAAWRNIAVCNIVENSEHIDSSAQQLMNAGLKQYDALHIACALAAQCDFFITTDKKILNKNITGISIKTPMQFIDENGEIS